MLYSGYRLMEINYHTANEQELRYEMLVYRPSLEPDIGLIVHRNPFLTEEGHHDFLPRINQRRIVNPSLIALQQTHERVVGWIYVPNTRVDYPFVQYDNEFYLSHDINHNRTPNGAIFLDERNNDEFWQFNTLIYGHNMRNGSMFATLRDFLGRDFFIANRYAYIFLPYVTYQIEIFAVAVIRPNDRIIYGLFDETEEERQEFIDHVRSVASHVRPYMHPNPNERFVTLSTCRNDTADSRIVVVGVLRPHFY